MKPLTAPYPEHTRTLLQHSAFKDHTVHLHTKKGLLHVTITGAHAKKVQQHYHALQQRLTIYEKMRSFL